MRFNISLALYIFNVRRDRAADRAVSKRNRMTSVVTDVRQDGFIWQRSKLVTRRYLQAAPRVIRNAKPRRRGLFCCPAVYCVSRRNFPAVSRLSSMASIPAWTLFYELTVSSINWVPEFDDASVAATRAIRASYFPRFQRDHVPTVIMRSDRACAEND